MSEITQAFETWTVRVQAGQARLSALRSEKCGLLRRRDSLLADLETAWESHEEGQALPESFDSTQRDLACVIGQLKALQPKLDGASEFVTDLYSRGPAYRGLLTGPRSVKKTKQLAPSTKGAGS